MSQEIYFFPCFPTMLNERVGIMPEKYLITTVHDSKLIKGLSYDEIGIILSCGKRTAFKENDIIIKEGQTGHSLFIVIKGKVEVFLPKEKENASMDRATRIRLDKLSKGDFIGEYSFIDKGPASASVVALEPCELVEIKRQDFEKILDTNDRLAKHIYKNMLKVIIKRARESDRMLDICY